MFRPRLLSTIATRCRSGVGSAAMRARACSTSTSSSGGGGSSGGNSASSVIARRLRSPVTWISATATLGALYGLYEFQYWRQANRQRAAGRPNLGGPWELVDPAGKRVSSEDYRGQWLLLYFGFTKCPDICPQELEKVSDVLTNLDARGQRVAPVFITIDPDRDDPGRLKRYFAEMGFHPRFVGLTGSADALRAACRKFRVYYTRPTAEELAAGDYLIDHSIISYLVDPEGNFVEYFGKSLRAAEMETKMSAVIRDWERARWMRTSLPGWLSELLLPEEPEWVADARREAQAKA
jgi:protein SCO1/2